MAGSHKHILFSLNIICGWKLIISHRLLHGGAVGGGADLVGDVDSTLSRKRFGIARVNTTDAAGKTLQAVASSLAVRGGLGQGVNGFDSIAASWRDSSATPHVVNAWCKVGAHLATCYGMSNAHSHAQGHHQSKLDHCRASHNELIRMWITKVCMSNGCERT